VDALVLAFAVGLGFSLGLTTWGRWVLFARFWLPLTGRLPWHLAEFLEDAHRRGVLRQVGAVYQFRDARLQQHLVRAATVPVTIYLSDEKGHRRVEGAVRDLLSSAGAKVDQAGKPVLGSWFRPLRAFLARVARSPEVRDMIAHSLDTRLIHAADAAVTKDMMENLGDVLASLATIEQAVIRVGALLIVKADGKVMVHQLTPAQQHKLDHEPTLVKSPLEILGALQALPAARMPARSFSGTYEDDQGTDPITWHMGPSDRYGTPAYEIRTTVRGTQVWGPDFDGLGLDDCRLQGNLPCLIDVSGERRDGAVQFALDLRQKDTKNLELSMTVGDRTHTVTDDRFEDGLHRLEEDLPDEVRLACCLTCLYSDYSPGGNGLMGMSCHRGAKAQYLAVRSKADYWTVPITEQVPETHVCPEYERRVPGTGYRG
jgi:hypothetical protein